MPAQRSILFAELTRTDLADLLPTRKPGYDAVVYLWARQSELAGGLETLLYAAVKDWIAKEWPFKKVAFPGRDIAWETWRAMADERR